jgi:hypothetical protein
MVEPRTSPGPRWLRGELVCPRCGNDQLEAVTDGTDTNFLCHECWTCWHVELGRMAPVPVSTCPGCPYKQECLRRRPPPEAGARP